MSNPSADIYRSLRNKVGKFTCDLCGAFWPVTTMRRMTGGAHVSTLCGDWEPDGDSEDRDLRRAYASRMGAILTMKESQPPKAPNGEVFPGTQDDEPSMIATIAPNPIVLSRGGAAVAVTLTGVGFTVSDVLTYGATGITDATSPVLVDATSRTLSVQASGGMAVGKYTFRFNDDIWQAVFDVR